ncbi:hypothetical protein MPH_11206 [Macrophomina phaseolina MS6]|uniref:Uncharacterized protein n=1 Tax=Macrophomina phaseolina (strain MS6) TaxID=1126212 RepID=K2RB08_MACPH|nr:hypothetical protein MPH_11206 [Macrophomina phaseolina MS6]
MPLTPDTDSGTRSDSLTSEGVCKNKKDGNEVGSVTQASSGGGAATSKLISSGIDCATQTDDSFPTRYSHLNPAAPAFAPVATDNDDRGSGLWRKPVTVGSLTDELSEERRKRAAAEAEAKQMMEMLERKDREIKAAEEQLVELREMLRGGGKGAN